MKVDGMGVTAVALVIPSLYALYGWYRRRLHDDILDTGAASMNGPVSIVSSERIQLCSDTHVRFQEDPSQQLLSEPPPTQLMASPHASSILYTSRGDVTVNVLDNNYLSSEARDYFAEVTDVSSENVHDDDLVTLRRADFDAMMGFVAKHLREIPPSIVVSATSHSIAPGTSLETMLSELAATDQANTPLSQIILLVDGSDDHATPSNDGSTSGASDAPSSSAAREMVRSFQRSRGVPPASRTTASSCRRCDEWNTMPPMTTLVPVMVRHGSPGTNPANKTKPTSPPTSHPRRIWESLFGKTAFENNADLDQSYFVFH